MRESKSLPCVSTGARSKELPVVNRFLGVRTGPWHRHNSLSLVYHLQFTFLGPSVFLLVLNKGTTALALMIQADERERPGDGKVFS